MGISFGEDAAGNNEQILLNGLFHKGLSVSSRDLRKDIKSALGLLDVELLFESVVNQVSFPFVAVNIILHAEIERLGRRFLSKGVDAGECVLLKGDHLLQDLLGTGRIA